MTESPRPTPYPPDTRAKGWRFELDYERIRQSDTWALATSEVRPWLLMLWMTAWEQTPCGSLPADDELIAARIGMPLDQFESIKKRLMRGWWLADDGRLYHSTLTERVLEMIAHRDGERLRKAAQRAAKESAQEASGEPARGKRTPAKKSPDKPPPSHGNGDGVPNVSHGTDAGLHRESDTGTGTGSKPKGTYDDGRDLIRGGAVDNSNGVAPSPPHSSSSLSAKEIAELLKLWECERGKNPRFAPDAQQIVVWAMRGITAEQLRIAYAAAVAQRDHDRDVTAVNAGFLDPFVAKALAPPKPLPLRTMTDAQLCDEAKRLTISIHGLDRAASIAKLEQVRTQQRGGHAA
ncbi:hypothetical protein OKW38_002249 [Paraburkholderia sp. MM5496-R1]|uniref:hypothetical protein n=1 Tax=Paraburkholderia sp. MM5496-R1 TaxID=2991065 RepID=UPI003D1F57A7